VTREMCQQEFHLVRQYLTTLQIHVFRMGRTKRDGQQFHACLLWCPAGFVVVAAFAGGDDIDPTVFAPLAQREDVIPGKQKARKLLTAIQTQALITPEQGFVTQWWSVVFGKQVFVGMLPCCGDDGIDADNALVATDGVDAAVDMVEGFSER